MQPRLIGLIVVSALVVLNTAGYLLYRQLVGGRNGEATAGVAAPKVEDRAAAAALPAPAATLPVTGGANQGDGESTLVRGYRAAGIQALEQGDYHAALENFEEAVRLGGKSDLPLLVKIATQMSDRAAGKSAPSASAVEDQQQGQDVVQRRVGTVVVTSSPPDLEVTVNGRVVDTTPATLDLRYGKYWIGLLRNGEEAYRRRVEIAPGAIVSINHDFTEGLKLGAAEPMAAAPRKLVKNTNAEIGIAVSPLAGIDSDLSAIEKVAAAAPPPPKTTKPVTVSYHALREYQVEGTQSISAPDIVVNQMRRAGSEKISATVMLCVSVTGEVTSRKVTKASDYAEYDSRLVDEVGRWRFKPFVRDGNPLPVCSTVTFVFKTR